MIPKLSAAYPVSSMVHSSNINTLKNDLQHMLSFYYRIWNNFGGGISSRIWNNFGGVFLPTVGIFSLCKQKSSEWWPVHNPKPHVKVYLNN